MVGLRHYEPPSFGRVTFPERPDEIQMVMGDFVANLLEPDSKGKRPFQFVETLREEVGKTRIA